LTSFGVDYEKIFVGSTGDGALVMVKFGKECPTLYKLCLNHRIQLGVCDTLYKKNLLWRMKQRLMTLMILMTLKM
jgi:hypothetical protein